MLWLFEEVVRQHSRDIVIGCLGGFGWLLGMCLLQVLEETIRTSLTSQLFFHTVHLQDTQMEWLCITSVPKR